MNVRETISYLQMLDPEALVVVSGQEGGFEPAEIVELKLYPDVYNDMHWRGPYEEVEFCHLMQKDVIGKEIVKAVGFQ